MRSVGFRVITFQAIAMFVKCIHVQFTTSYCIAHNRVLCVRYFYFYSIIFTFLPAIKSQKINTISPINVNKLIVIL